MSITLFTPPSPNPQSNQLRGQALLQRHQEINKQHQRAHLACKNGGWTESDIRELERINEQLKNIKGQLDRWQSEVPATPYRGC